MPAISKPNIYAAWKSILGIIRKDGKEVKIEKDNKTISKEVTREVLNLFVTIENPLDEQNFDQFPLTKNQINEFANLLLDEEQANWGGFIPGKRLNNFLGYKQWDEVCKKLKERSETRRASIILCEPSRDWHDKRPPCLLLIDFKIRDNKLHLTAVIRSNDMFKVWPANAYSLAKLLEKTCERLKEIQVRPGSLNILSISAHIYEDDMKKLESVLNIS